MIEANITLGIKDEAIKYMQILSKNHKNKEWELRGKKLIEDIENKNLITQSKTKKDSIKRRIKRKK